jgi:hypothetical protein
MAGGGGGGGGVEVVVVVVVVVVVECRGRLLEEWSAGDIAYTSASANAGRVPGSGGRRKV